VKGILHLKNSLNVARRFNGFRHVHILMAGCRRGESNETQKLKNRNMRLKLLVQTQEFQSWPATKERAASTSHNLVCVDMSQPADARMTESISYRLKDEEIPKHWDKAMDKIIEVNLRRIAHSKSGKASIIGEIVETTPAK
jgi:hypothetical protein